MTEALDAAKLLADLETRVSQAPVSELPALLGTLEKVKVMGWGRMLTTHNGQGTPTPTQFLTPQEVAGRLGVNVSYVYELARAKKLKSTKMGKYRRFDEAAVQAFQASQGG